ncbi:MAG: archaeoflavoprotein AfpA [Methanosarcinaceae archaeon]|nr:archaeoflavoprotein AfpA [Methanosarcinaceae archaeon]
MNEPNKNHTNNKLAWGITGAGDKLEESVKVMKELKEKGYLIDVFLSKEAATVLKMYKLCDEIKTFESVKKEKGPNSPFVVGPLQTGEYKALIVTPATANTVAKIVYGIADTLITNAVSQTSKSETPIYIYPVDNEPGTIETSAPNGRKFKLKMRKTDLENTNKLKEIENIHVLKNPDSLADIF